MSGELDVKRADRFLLVFVFSRALNSKNGVDLSGRISTIIEINLGQTKV